MAEPTLKSLQKHFEALQGRTEEEGKRWRAAVAGLPAGPTGPAGPQGPVGPIGPEGSPGKDLSAALNALTQRVAALEAAQDPEPQPEPDPAGKVLYRLDTLPAAHKVLGGWYNQSNPERTSTTPNGFRFEIRQGDQEEDTKKATGAGLEMAEVSMSDDLPAGTEAWVRHLFGWPTDDSANPSWETVHEWHDANNNGLSGGSFSPAVALFRYGQQLRLLNGKGSPVYWTGPQVERGKMNELLYRLLLDQKAGELEAFWNGTALPVFKGLTTNTGLSYLKIGSYRARGTTGTSVTLHPKLVIATTKAAALAA